MLYIYINEKTYKIDKIGGIAKVGDIKKYGLIEASKQGDKYE